MLSHRGSFFFRCALELLRSSFQGIPRRALGHVLPHLPPYRRRPTLDLTLIAPGIALLIYIPATVILAIRDSASRFDSAGRSPMSSWRCSSSSSVSLPHIPCSQSADSKVEVSAMVAIVARATSTCKVDYDVNNNPDDTDTVYLQACKAVLVTAMLSVFHFIVLVTWYGPRQTCPTHTREAAIRSLPPPGAPPPRRRSRHAVSRRRIRHESGGCRARQSLRSPGRTVVGEPRLFASAEAVL